MSPAPIWLSIYGCLAAAGAFLYANQVETRRYRLETLNLTIGSGGHQESLGKRRSWRILHLSDLHLCHPESDKVRFLEQISNDDYDLVFLTGDIFENFTGLPYAGSILRRPPRLGAYAVLGNHDYYNYTILNKTVGRVHHGLRTPPGRRDVSPMIRALNQSGFTVLGNSAVNLPEAGLHIIGIDYPTVEMDRLRELASQASPGQAVFVLFHLPVNLERISTVGAHLAFGGHTHGGQVCLPGWGAIITDSELPPRQASGLIRRGRTIFHISRGLGADPRTNIRLFCPPAATVLNVTWVD